MSPRERQPARADGAYYAPSDEGGIVVAYYAASRGEPFVTLAVMGRVARCFAEDGQPTDRLLQKASRWIQARGGSGSVVERVEVQEATATSEAFALLLAEIRNGLSAEGLSFVEDE